MPLEIVPNEKWIRETYRVKGKSNVILVSRILKTVKGYKRLTLRQLFYVMVSRFPRTYPTEKKFYKRLGRYTSKIRRVRPDINKKFVDPTRTFSVPPLVYRKRECWVEKESLKIFLSPLAIKYRLGIQVLRGFASLSMFRRAWDRAIKRKVTHVKYVGDFDASGLLIENVAAREMNSELRIKFERVALTMEQISRLRPPSRPVNKKDSRARAYVAKYGNRCWEVESVRPRTLYKIVEKAFKANVPPEFLIEAKEREIAARVVRHITERLRREIEREALVLLRRGIPEEEVHKHIGEKYGVTLRTRRR